jgi:type IV secretion system protein VirB10
MNIFKRKNSSNDSEPEHIEGERSVASVNNSVGATKRITNMLIMVVIIGVVLFGLGKYYANYFKEKREAAATDKADTTKTAATNVPPLKALAIDPPPSPVAQLQPPPQQTVPGTAPGQPVPLTPAQVAEQRRLTSGVFFKIESSSGGGGGQGQGGTPGASGASYAGATGTESDGGAAGSDPLSKSLQPSRQSGAKAYMLADPSLTVTKGSVIPCNVVPALDSTLPGIVSCIQSADVWSTDGKVVLLERGTKWVGEQKFGLSQGQRRLGMLWTRGETPHHVLIDVDSGTADHLGRPGLFGEIDNRFWDRFGGAILISLIGDVGSFLSATQSGNGGGATAIAFPGTVNGAQSAMSDVLKSTLSIPPTLTKNAGAAISIYVARDLDFRDVYMLESKQ